MTLWRDCRNELERQQAIADAMSATGGVVSDAAKVLRMNRQYLHEVLAGYARQMATVGSSDSVGRVGSVGRTDTTDNEGADGRVGPTILDSLTSWLPAPSFRRVSSVASMVEMETSKMTFEPPKELKDWLEKKALDRKQTQGGRFAVSPIIVEILQRAKAAEEQR